MGAGAALSREGGAAAAGGARVRVIEREPAVLKAADKIDFHAQKVNGMRLVHHHIHAIDRKPVVVFLGLVKAEYIGKAGAAAAFDAYTQAIIGRNIFLLADNAELFDSAVGQRDGHLSRKRRFKHRFHEWQFFRSKNTSFKRFKMGNV